MRLFFRKFNKETTMSRKSERGAALLMSILIVNIVMFLALEVSNQSIGDFFASSSEVKKVQAYYAARSCLQLSLLRVKAYKQVTAAVANLTAGRTLPPGLSQQIAQLDMIWKFPLAWPPALPGDASSFDKSTFSESVGSSFLEEEFASSIIAESARIDINDLGSPSKALRERTRRQILERLQARVENSEDSFAIRYASFNFEELVNNITDWVDADNSSLNGGNEKELYGEFENEFYPPNRPFKTLKELHMVSGMTDEVFALLEPEITLFGGKGVNVNLAEKDVLDSLFSRFDAQLIEEVVARILERRDSDELGGPFADLQDFSGFIQGLGIDLETFNEERIPLFFGPEINFKVSCTGTAGKIFRDINAVIYGGDNVEDRLLSALKLGRKSESRNLEDECRDTQGDDKYQCLCQEAAEGRARTECITREKEKEKKKAKSPAQNRRRGNTEGPPPMIFLEVQ